jgi:hypothetical protein
VRSAALFVIAVSYGRGIGFEDSADDDFVGEHVVGVVAPLARRARCRRAFQDQGH